MMRKTKIMAMLWLLGLCGLVVAMEGSGTEEDPYIVTNVFELQAMQDDLDAYYELGNDIDASDTQNWNGGAGFEPVGNGSNNFTGIFDGRGHTITGLYINRPSGVFIGLFGYISGGAEIKNVELIYVDVSGRGHVGSLVGLNTDSTISDCGVVGGKVSGTGSKNGGLIGKSWGAGAVISKCYADVRVAGGVEQTGGLLGVHRKGGLLHDSYARGDVSGSRKVGGLVGDNMGEGYGTLIERCYSTGKVTGGGGGLVGYNWRGGSTQDSYWDKQTSGKTSSYGGTGRTTAQMMQQATFVNWDFVDVWDIVENETYPFLRPVLEPTPVYIDIRPGSCPNPLNVDSRGVLPVAVLGSEDFDVNSIDAASIRLADDVAPVRSSYEDVAALVSDGNECECTTEGPDEYTDLTLKFKTQEVVEQLVDTQAGLAESEVLTLSLTGKLNDGTLIEGADCMVVVGKVPRPLAARRLDINGDGIVNILDFGLLAQYWLEPAFLD